LEGLPVTYEGRFYTVKNLTLTPKIAPELRPGILVSGSSEAGIAAAQAMEALAVRYPEPPDQAEALAALPKQMACGVRLGIIARPDAEEAWRIAHKRFPDDRKGQLTRQLATKVSDSVWHHRLAELSSASKEAACEAENGWRDPYWLHPFENYQTNCPYLVGDYDCVSRYLAKYMAFGYFTFILDIPPAHEEFPHISSVFTAARNRA
jgi:alkanesulfonate monooxygenase